MLWNVWVVKKVNEFEGDIDNEQDDIDSGEEFILEGLEGILKEDKKEVIRLFLFLSFLVQKIMVVDLSDEDMLWDSMEEVGLVDDVFVVLKDLFKCLYLDSFWYWQLKYMFGEEE